MIHQGKINKFVDSVTLIFISQLVKLGLTDCWSTSSSLVFLGLKTDFENRCHGDPGDKSGPLIGRNLPEVVNKIVWVRQLIHKVGECGHTVYLANNMYVYT